MRSFTPGLLALALGLIPQAGTSAQNCAIPASVEVVPSATVGTGGSPTLLVTTAPVVGTVSNLVHSGGPANALGCLVASTVEAPVYVARFGGVFYPGASPDRRITCFQLDAESLSPPLLMDFSNLDPALCGLTYVAQSVILDPAAQGGVSFSDALRIRFGSGVDIPMTADQDTLLTNNQTQLRLTAEVPNGSAVNGNGVQLFEVDENFVPQGPALCQLFDNGDLGNGDDIAGDGLFSCLEAVLQSVSGELRLAALATIAGVDHWSRILVIPVVDPLSSAQVTTLISGQAAAQTAWNLAMSSLGDTPAARAATVVDILAQAGVADAGVSTDGLTIWIRYDSGVRGGLMLNPPGTRGTPVTIDDLGPQASRPAAVEGLASPLLPTKRVGPVPSGQMYLGAEAEPTITGNNKVLIWDAYNSQFAPFDEAPALQALYNNSTCPTFDVTLLVDAQATVSSVRSFTNYGTIILVTHGAVDGDGQVVFLTRESVTLVSVISHAVDLVLGRISIMGDVFAIRPSFVSSLPGSFEDGIFYNGSCQSSANSTMNTAFIGKGMKTAYAYTRVVNSDFAQSAATQLFTAIVNGDMPTGDAFSGVSPKTDPTSPFAVFTQSGDTNLKYSGAFKNGSFEDELEGWTTMGDGRTLLNLGQFAPQDGQRMGIISTGLGFTTDSGSIEQEFCLPVDATTLTFDWNYSSEEFVEYCNSSFEDLFRVSIVTETDTTVLLSETVSSLCSGVVPSSLFFDQSAPPCNPTDGVGFGTGGNDCIVWTTGWTQSTIDISALAAAAAGGAVTLRFESSDVGDSIYDTAILLDNIEITTP